MKELIFILGLSAAALTGGILYYRSRKDFLKDPFNSDDCSDDGFLDEMKKEIKKSFNIDKPPSSSKEFQGLPAKAPIEESLEESTQARKPKTHSANRRRKKKKTAGK